MEGYIINNALGALCAIIYEIGGIYLVMNLLIVYMFMNMQCHRN